jgi:N6-adenosine-specific RNA methylase IME4
MVAHGYDPSHPIWLYEGKIIDGQERLRAAQEAGVTPVYQTWIGDDPWEFVWRENAARRQLEPGVRAALRIMLLEGSAAWHSARVAKRAEANGRRAAKLRGNKNALKSITGVATPNSPVSRETAPPLRERDVIARDAGVSPSTAGRVIELRQKAPKLFEELAAGRTTLAKARGQQELDEKDRLAAELRASPPPLPRGRYGVLVVDPPWRFDRGEGGSIKPGRTRYPTMTTDEIRALPIPRLAEKDAILWLWTTNAHMRQALEVLAAWGFQEKTMLTWVKHRSGLGDWLLGQTEHALLAVRGKPLFQLTNQTTVLHAKRREHSRKPDEFFELVEALCPGSKVDFFSRESRRGWASWGAEAGKFDADK